MFTLAQAAAFVAVAEEGHFGRAADRLHMTQPPLSRQIQKLERELGADLFTRHPRGVDLTAAGDAFLEECRSLLHRAEQAPARARLIAEGRVGRVRIGYTATSAHNTLGALLTRIKAHAPGVEVELHELVSRQQVTALRDGVIDLGLARPPFRFEGVETQLVHTEGLSVALEGDHPLALRETPIASTELRDEPIIMHASDTAKYFRDLVTELLDVQEHQISHSASQVLTMMALVASGHGIAVVPDSARQISVSGVRVLPLSDCPPRLVELYAIWDSESTNPALHTVLPLLHADELGPPRP